MGIEPRTEVAREVRRPDDAEDVGEVLKPVGRGHARSELHLDEAVKRDDPVLLARERGLKWIRECNGLGLPIARELSRDEEVDLDVVDGVPDRLASRPDVHVAAPEPLGLEAIETLAPDQNVHVDGEALEAV